MDCIHQDQTVPLGIQLVSSRSVILRHKQPFHNESNPFRCDVCDQRFKTQISLRRHKTVHEKPRYKCEVGEQINAPIATIVVCFSRMLKCLRSRYGKQRGPRSDQIEGLFWVHAVGFYTKFISNVRQLFAADDFSRQHFQMHFLLGA